MTNDSLLRRVAEKGVQNPERQALGRFDWLLKALEIFISEGIDAVRITRLADELEVTRGSFYWHFSNREDLIQALVDYWRDKNTRAIIDAVSDAPSLDEGILDFFEACVDEQKFDPRLDLAVREWSRRSDEIRTEMESADKARIDALADFYRRFDYPKVDALIRARVIYFAQIGFYALGTEESMETRLGYHQAYYTVFTGRELSSTASKKFRRRMMKRFGDH